MLDSLYNFRKYNNENNLFISTNITYFPKLLGCPDIPTKHFDESLVHSRVTSQEYASLAHKMKEPCKNFITLTALWLLRWITRFVFLYFFIMLFVSDYTDKNIIFLVVMTVIKLLLFGVCYFVMESYRTRIQEVLNNENDSTYKSRNLYWKIVGGCRYIHLVLDYSHFSCQDTIVSIDDSRLQF